MQIFKSRTVWTIFALFIIGGTTAVDSFIPGTAKPIVAAILGLLGIYFRTNPQKQF